MSVPVLYALFAAVVLVLLAIDLLVVHRDTHEVSLREAGIWSVVWIGVAVAFGAILPYVYDGGPAVTVEYFTGYVIEKSLAVDNIFLFVLIFGAFAVPKALQHRVLFYGVVGAIVARTLLIFAGAALVERFSWVLIVFGLFLLFTGYKTWRQRHSHPDPAQSRMLTLVRRLVPTTQDYRGEHFFVREQGRLLATPLFVVLVLVEITDVVFAVDSIPAIFAVTRDPFIVLTSNIFAILGLRALYFLLAGMVTRLRFLKAGLAVILGYVGLKILVEQVEFLPHPSPLVSLGVVLFILAVTVAASLWPPAGRSETDQAASHELDRDAAR